nr:hypothetical protein [Tanacetum cinerariifolium]
MIYGCVKMGFEKGVLKLFKEIKRDGFEPDEMSVLIVLGMRGDLGLGKVVEENVVENEMEMVFDKMGRKDLVTWNAMITRLVKLFSRIAKIGNIQTSTCRRSREGYCDFWIIFGWLYLAIRQCYKALSNGAKRVLGKLKGTGIVLLTSLLNLS